MPGPKMRIDERLKEWATEQQCRIIDAINKHRSYSGAARELGLNKSSIRDTVNRCEKKAAIFGYSPQHDLSKPVAPGQRLRGASTLYRRGEAEPVLQWVKSREDEEQREAIIREAIKALSKEIPRAAPIAPPTNTAGALCNVYTFTDSHVGMLAWHKEGGADWDLKIAEATLTGCFEHMVAASPPASVAFVNQLGDFIHYDSLQPVTPTSGHILDADGRFEKMVGVAVSILRRIVDSALEKHDKVVLLVAEGNHDMASSVWLRHMFRALYENEPRIEVISSPLPYYAYQHGETMLAFHHGHLKKTDQLPLLMASQFPTMWGATRKRYAHTGHLHHTEEKEHSGMTVHQHPTLAARDAHSARSGYISGRNVTSLTYHAKFGEVARNTVTPEMLSPTEAR